MLAALDPSAAISAPRCSPEAAAARAAFVAARPLLVEQLLASVSGRELVARGWDDDVHTCAALDVTDLAAQLVDGEFVASTVLAIASGAGPMTRAIAVGRGVEELVVGVDHVARSGRTARS